MNTLEEKLEWLEKSGKIKYLIITFGENNLLLSMNIMLLEHDFNLVCGILNIDNKRYGWFGLNHFEYSIFVSNISVFGESLLTANEYFKPIKVYLKEHDTILSLINTCELLK